MKNRFLCLAAISFSIILLTLPPAASGADAGFKPTVALKLFGGLGYQAIGDLNTGLKGFSDSIIYTDLSLFYSAGGGYCLMHYGLDAGGDLIFQFSRYVGIGVGSGYLRTARKSELRLTAPDPSLHNELWTFDPVVSVVPIRVGLFLFVPIGGYSKISLNIGPEYYLASVQSNLRDDYPAWWWNERNEEFSGRGFGVHGGIGLEIGLSSKVALILEGQGRLAKINELTGTHVYKNSFGFEEKIEGTLYYWTDYWTFKPFPYVFISETLPSEPWQSNPRKAVLDLSGFSAVAGFIFRF